ncbi:hypothetical protein THAOC_13505 [Thalassiosira oceanica]|uniref:Uncharacterized protein n=1 Tax=Thalassiosira oceanica TaxID=159749 RepID=K0SJW9_THAOC|nr:hypothetical protein THAOC_13505 [Thalassiosira oceanica]|eukprot:EJK65615.1 hypothetical protein THAOC_13505 [Thalassiosira oceanica]
MSPSARNKASREGPGVRRRVLLVGIAGTRYGRIAAFRLCVSVSSRGGVKAVCKKDTLIEDAHMWGKSLYPQDDRMHAAPLAQDWSSRPEHSTISEVSPSPQMNTSRSEGPSARPVYRTYPRNTRIASSSPILK